MKKAKKKNNNQPNIFLPGQSKTYDGNLEEEEKKSNTKNTRNTHVFDIWKWNFHYLVDCCVFDGAIEAFAQQIYAGFDCPKFYESLGIDFDEGIFLLVLKWFCLEKGVWDACEV